MEQVYPSDLTEEQWQVIAPLIPPARPGGRPRRVNILALVNGMFYLHCLVWLSVADPAEGLSTLANGL
ncbi:MAG: transposase [Thermoguttaceae bacterium]|nr:transposase [Thermoguttaceae bacterium]